MRWSTCGTEPASPATESQATEAQPPTNPGEAIYKEYCIVCHQADGSGKAPGSDRAVAGNFSGQDSVLNKSDQELYSTLPFPNASALNARLQAFGFKGQLIWTLPMWCFDEPRRNLYRRQEHRPDLLLEQKHAAAFVDLAAYTCPLPSACAAMPNHNHSDATRPTEYACPDAHKPTPGSQLQADSERPATSCVCGSATCAAPTCAHTHQAPHQCIPGPPDDMAAVVLHHILNL